MAQQAGPPEITWCMGSPQVSLSTEDDSGLEDGDDSGVDHGHRKEEGSTIFVAFKGNLDDEDFQQKLDNILNGMPQMLLLGKGSLGV